LLVEVRRWGFSRKNKIANDMAVDTVAFHLDDSPIKADWASMKNVLDIEEYSVYLMKK
jgi:hypothetical protein